MQDKLVDIIKKLEALKELHSFAGFKNDIEYYKNRINDIEFKIAVVGEFSSGKSTFINAVIGKDVLKHGSEETTAVITRIINVNVDDVNAFKGKVFLKNGDEKILEDLNSLTEYTTTKSSIHNVVNEVEKVEVYVPFIGVNHKLVMIDTPGLNGKADGHREQTVNMIKQAHACIYLLQKRGLTDSDIQFIKYLNRYQNNFIFLQNFIDEFCVSEGDDLDIILAGQKKILDEEVFNDNHNVTYSLCGISALLKLVASDKSIKKLYKADVRELNDNDRKELFDKSNYEEFSKLLKSRFSDDNIERLQFGDTAISLAKWVETLEYKIKLRHSQELEVLENSRNTVNHIRLEKLRQSIIENTDKYKKKIRNFVISQCELLEGDFKINVSDEINEVKNRMTKEIDDCNNLQEFKLKSQQIPHMLDQDIDDMMQNVLENMNIKIHNLKQLILNRIEEYTGIQTEEFDIEKLNVPNNDFSNKQFMSDNSEIVRIEQLVRQNVLEYEKLLETIQEGIEEISNAESNLNEKKELVAEVNRIYDAKLKAMGYRPAPKRVIKYSYEERDHRWYEGGLFADFFCGPKKVRVEREVMDYSAVEAYDKDMANLKSHFTTLIQSKEKDVTIEERKLERLKNNYSHLEEKRKRIENSIKNKKAEVIELKRELELKEKKAARAFLNIEKSKLKNNVYDYLEGSGNESVYYKVVSYAKENLESIRQQIIDSAIISMDDAIKVKQKRIDSCLNNELPEVKNKIEVLEHTTNKLNDILAIIREV